MVIYGEYLFLENFITGIVITHFTGKFAGYPTSAVRLLLCGCLCGAYAFTLFTGISGIGAAASKSGFALLISLLAFGTRPGQQTTFKPLLKKAVRGGIIFLLTTFFYGGIAIAILSWMSWQGITAAGGVYMGPAGYLGVTGAAAAAALVIEYTVSLIRKKRKVQMTRRHVTLRIGKKEWQAEGFLDSGNFLVEPLTGKPVAVTAGVLFEKIKRESGSDPKRFAAIPYSSVGVAKGILEGYRIDELKVSDAVIRNAFLAVWVEEKAEQPEILLPEALIDLTEGGIYADVD